MTSPTPFALELEFNMEGYDNVWMAMGAILSSSRQPQEAIIRAEYKGTSPLSWPILHITFTSIEVARGFVCAYLGYDEHSQVIDVYVDDEIEQHIRTGLFVNKDN
jgi:hypothetical protein